MSWTERIRRKAVEATVGWTVEKLLTAIGSLLAAIISPFLLRYVPWVGEALKARVAIPVWVLLTVVLVVVAAAGLLARSRPRPAGQPSSVTVTPPPGTDPSGERELERARQELHQTKGELEIVREEIKRLAPPKTPFFYFGYCWELLPYFFRCREIQTPGDGTLDNTVMGPFCPRCARPLKHDAGRGDYAIESPCGRVVIEDKKLRTDLSMASHSDNCMRPSIERRNG